VTTGSATTGSATTGAMPVATETRSLADGRRVTFRLTGTTLDGLRDRPLVLALHGTPGSRLKFTAAEPLVGALNLAMISIDRWGYGASDPHPRPSLAAFADDMRELLDQLGLTRASVVGVSGGGPFAAALAAVHPDRVSALALVAPVGPVAAVPGGEGYRTFHRFCFTLMPRVPGATALVFHIYRGLLRAAPLTAAGLISARAGSVDRRIVLMPEVRARLSETFALGLESGVAGPVIDLDLFSRPWDIDLAAIRAPTRLWLGCDDRNVPHRPVEVLTEQIPSARLTRLEGQGHYWIALNYGEVLRWLAEAGPRR
jgi:pimeloyl-ACP methyl ester carboxylesterase